jgi:acyl carrier protein
MLVNLITEVAPESTKQLDDNTPLISSGMLDSFAMLDLVSGIEVLANIKIKPRDISIKNLDSLQCLRDFLTKVNVYTTE